MTNLVKPKISVIIPAHNEEFYIERALNSVEGQTYPYIETIVVSNGSSDRTAEVSNKYTSNIYETNIKGVSRARNIGVEKASGDIITFLDADSSMEKTLAEKAVIAMDEHYSGGKAKRVPDPKTLKSRLYYVYDNFCSDLAQLLSAINPNLLDGAGAFMFTDRKHIETLKWKYGEVFNETLETMEDVDFLRKLRREGKLKLITNSYVTTSTRHYDREGYIRRAALDWVEYSFPEGKKRKVIR